jgi:hypothetical protein
LSTPFFRTKQEKWCLAVGKEPLGGTGQPNRYAQTILRVMFGVRHHFGGWIGYVWAHRHEYIGIWIIHLFLGFSTCTLKKKLLGGGFNAAFYKATKNARKKQGIKADKNALKCSKIFVKKQDKILLKKLFYGVLYLIKWAFFIHI